MPSRAKPDPDRKALIEEHLRLFRDLLEGEFTEDFLTNATLDQIEERVSLLKAEMELDLTEHLVKEQTNKQKPPDT